MAVSTEHRSVARPLPRLAIMGDIFVERTCAGALLLYRLLEEYPPERLLVVSNTANGHRGEPTKRLPGVRYIGIPCPIPRTISSRLHPVWPILLPEIMRGATIEAMSALQEFGPEAILTVPSEFFWLAAASAARELGIPLHLIVHDDWASTITFNRGGSIGMIRRWFARRLMRPLYRQAQARLCVSPGMVEHNRSCFGAGADILYPSRGEDSPEPRLRVRNALDGPPVVAYCGLIHQAGTVSLLHRLAIVLATMSGRLDYYGPYSADDLAGNWGLTPPVVRSVGFLPAAEMGERIGRSAHALFLPASFEPREREDVSTLFPSKLADYTAIGLPILVWGPEYSSAARWAAENPGATVCITEPDPTAVELALDKLVTDPARAASIATAGIAAGNRYFGLHATRAAFLSAISPVECFA